MTEYPLTTIENGQLYIAGVQGYSNVSSLKNALCDNFSCCGVIGLENVVCLQQLQFAALRASTSFLRGSMKTTRFSDEILYNLSPSTKITDALAQFSIREDSPECALVCFSRDPTEFPPVLEFLRRHDCNIQTTELKILPPTSEKHQEWTKLYKLTFAELQVSSFEEAVLNKLAVKDFIK
jgi:hypothetical protein